MLRAASTSRSRVMLLNPIRFAAAMRFDAPFATSMPPNPVPDPDYEADKEQLTELSQRMEASLQREKRQEHLERRKQRDINTSLGNQAGLWQTGTTQGDRERTGGGVGYGGSRTGEDAAKSPGSSHPGLDEDSAEIGRQGPGLEDETKHQQDLIDKTGSVTEALKDSAKTTMKSAINQMKRTMMTGPDEADRQRSTQAGDEDPLQKSDNDAMDTPAGLPSEDRNPKDDDHLVHKRRPYSEERTNASLL